MISSLLHIVGLRLRVYYTLTNFSGWGGGGKAPLAPPQYANALTSLILFDIIMFPMFTVHGQGDLGVRVYLQDEVDSRVPCHRKGMCVMVSLIVPVHSLLN